MKIMKWQIKEPSNQFFDILAILIYLFILLYVLVIRVILNIVDYGDSELFPVEILTTASIITTIIVIYLIYKKDLLKIGKNNRLYAFLLITFIAYFLAENNWLPGRDKFTLGLFVYGAIIGLVFLLTLRIIYRVNKKSFLTFILGIIFLIMGTSVDAMNDGVFIFEITLSNPYLLEEVFELYGSLFFLHTFLLLYFGSNDIAILKMKKRLHLVKISVGSLIISYGNSYFLLAKENQIPLKIIFGLLIVIFGLIVIYMLLNDREIVKSFLIPKVQEKGKNELISTSNRP